MALVPRACWPILEAVLVLSRLLGGTVRGAGGAILGDLVDVAIRADEPHPSVTALIVRNGRRRRGAIPWASVSSFGPDGAEATEVPTWSPDGTTGLPPLWLARDVLDTQVIDVAGSRVGRVAEIFLEPSEGALSVVAVDLGTRGVLRRLGLERWAGGVAEQLVAWRDLHLTSPRGHALQLNDAAPAVERLDAAQVASLVEYLPTKRAAEVLDSLPHPAAADALRRTSPRLAPRLLEAIERHSAPDIVRAMPVDDAVALLRHCSTEQLESVLASVDTQRAGVLRHLLGHPAGTAGGLMTPAVRTVGMAEPAAQIRRRLADLHPEPGEVDAVFVVDAEGRPVGCWEPIDLMSDDARPRAALVITADARVERVIDLLALHDASAVAVVDSAGTLIGAVGIDDALEELLVERLPGGGRYHGLRRRRRRSGRPATGPVA
jgi:sporulation protein YlmC with PRC-barrel domain/CBS domain-containing protein